MKKIIRMLKGRKTISAADAQYNLLARSRVDWAEYAKGLPEHVDDPVRFFIREFEDYPLIVTGWFDSSYYLSTNDDVRLDGSNPLVHFLLYGASEGRRGFSKESIPAKATETEAVNAGSKGVAIIDSAIAETSRTSGLPKPKQKGLIDTLRNSLSLYSETSDDENLEIDEELLEEAIERSEFGDAKIPGFFDQRLYELMYADLRKASVNTLHHFLYHGRNEGRVGWLSPDQFLLNGSNQWDYTKKTLVVVSHEASATGAPIVALEVASRFAGQYNVITMSLRPGKLKERFVDAGCYYVDVPPNSSKGVLTFIFEYLIQQYSVDTVLLNSVESIDALDAASSLGLPTVSLLHEFAEYTRPLGKISRNIYTSDIVVYPAESLAQSGLAEFAKTTGSKTKPSNIKIQPQGYLGFSGEAKNSSWSLRQQIGVGEDALIILGAGHVQQRKGVDWFLQSCHYLKKILSEAGDPRADRLEFVWLGGGYDKDDTQVSVWLDTYMKQTGIAENCHFPGAVSDVKAAMDEADIYLLSSRLDPFPNVAIDALTSDCSIAVFEGASGIADFVMEHKLRAVSAPYGDTHALAVQMAVNLDHLVERDGTNAKACSKYLLFDDYLEALEDYLGLARQKQSEIDDVIRQSSVFNGRFDPDFYALPKDDGNAKRHFLSLLHNGVVLSKPFPGSGIVEELSERPKRADETFYHFVERIMEATVPELPVVTLTGVDGEPAFKGRVALQFHIYYADLIPEYCAYFKTLVNHDVDMFVSHVPELTDEQIEMLSSSISGTVKLYRLENKGRDVYPFHKLFVDDIYGEYEVVGHFHTKKSADNDAGVGDRWRRYLLSNLMGSPAGSSEVLGCFADSNVGIVFAEDSHLVDEAGNGTYIEELLDTLGSRRRDCYRHFPIGTMFWARTDALERLKKWPESTFAIKEPIPYDGSVLHAFERLLPQLVEEAGFTSVKVYTKKTSW